MKKITALLCIAFPLLWAQCKKEEEPQPDFIGFYQGIALTQECTDASQNVSISSGSRGICRPVDGGEDCLDLTLTMNADMTYELKTITYRVRAGGGFVTSENAVDEGTYSVGSTAITLCSGSCIDMQFFDLGKRLKWIVTDVEDCEIFYEFVKS